MRQRKFKCTLLSERIQSHIWKSARVWTPRWIEVWEGLKRQSLENFQRSESLVQDIATQDTRHYTCVQIHRVHKFECWCKLQLCQLATCQCRFIIATLYHSSTSCNRVLLICKLQQYITDLYVSPAQ
jgi:hypothetical protein